MSDHLPSFPSVRSVRAVGAPVETAELVVIALHGRERSAAEMISVVVEPVSAMLGSAAERVGWIVPEAEGGVWYSGRASEVDPDDGEVLDALAAIASLVAWTGRRREEIVALGFSQGASTVTEFVSRNPGRWAGVVCLTGMRIGRPGEQPVIDGDLGGTPVYVSTADSDDWAPVDRVVAAATDLVRAGASLTLDVVAGRAHDVSEREIGRVAGFLADVLRRRGTS